MEGTDSFERFAKYLHEVGAAVMEPGREYICLKVGTLTRIIGAFISPPAHMRSILLQSSRGRHDIITYDDVIARLQLLNKLGCSSSTNDGHIHIVQCEVALQFLTNYGICGSLTEREARMYGKSGYVFPSLRYPCEVLTIPFLGDREPVPPHVIVRGGTEWLCKACGRYTPERPPGLCPFCSIPDCGTFVCSSCHCDVHNELGGPGNVLVVSGRGSAAQDGSVECVSVKGDGYNYGSAVRVYPKLWGCGCVDVRNGTEGKTMLGFRMRSSRGNLCFGGFSRLVAKLRPLIDPRFRVYSNLVSLRDAIGNDILIAFQPTAWEGISASTLVAATPDFKDPNKKDAFLYVVVYGVSPHAWRRTVPALFETCDVAEPLCLKCLQSDTFNVLLPPVPPSQGGNNNSGAAAAAAFTKEDDARPLVCAVGHRVDASTIPQNGVTLDQTVRRNKLWAPIYRDNFYECSKGLWVKMGPALVTTLTEKEKTPARREEYLRARRAFYQFVGKNMEDVIRLTKVEFIQNDALEAPFTEFFTRLTQRSLFLENPCSIKGSAANKSADGITCADIMSLTLKDTDDGSTEEWRGWILGQLQNSMYRISGNDGINLILGWHGTSEDNVRSIMRNNFYDMTDPEFAAGRKTDPGFFGPGVYFSQYPAYGSAYAEKRRSNTLILSWVLMGTTYPVTEEPMTLNNLVPGYDSHYAIVDSKFGRPIHPSDPPGYDEIVVFQKKQILPRYVIHFERVENPTPGIASPTAAPSLYKSEALPPELKDAYPVFIWFDPNFDFVDVAMEGFRITVNK